MPIRKLEDYLEKNHVKYHTIPHAQAFTAQETAAAAHVPGKELAKPVMVKVDDIMTMVVLTATDQLSLERLRKATGARTVALATEAEFRDLFPECEPGAMPPFGNLWDLPVFVDQRLREDETIAFEAGTHNEMIRMSYSDFERLVEPAVAELSTR
jgi:Ala-tRNA(Pro) deacylase